MAVRAQQVSQCIAGDILSYKVFLTDSEVIVFFSPLPDLRDKNTWTLGKQTIST